MDNMSVRKYITKSRSTHYTATVKDSRGETIFQQGKLANKVTANYLADQFILEYR